MSGSCPTTEYYSGCSAVAFSGQSLEPESLLVEVPRGLPHLFIVMGKLIKNHWARLIILTAAICKLFDPALEVRQIANAFDRPNCRSL